MAVDIAGSAHMYFDSTMDDGYGFRFARPINRLILTVVSGTVNLSLDGGSNFMALVVGTHQLEIYNYKIVFSGGGVYSGFGISL